MAELNMIQNKKTARQLAALAELFKKGQVSDIITRSVDKMLAYEIEQCQTQLLQLSQDLAEFEQQYNWSSTEFYQQYQGGLLDDRIDYVEWASLFQMNVNLKERLLLLTDEE